MEGREPVNGLPEIRLTSANFTVGHWVPHRGLDNDKVYDPFDLNAPYQRGSVWGTDTQRALIKSLIMGVPVGSIIVSKLPYNPKRADYRIVDGKQRIETIRSFIDGKLAIPRHWLRDEYVEHPDKPVAVVHYSDLSSLFTRGFEFSTPMPALEFDAHTEYMGKDSNGKPKMRKRSEEEMLRAEAEVFLLVNTYGVRQSSVDIDRAVAVAEGVSTLNRFNGS